MPFILDVTHHPNGFTDVTYDIGPAQRATVRVATVALQETLNAAPGDLLAHTLSPVRPPTQSRKQSQS